MLGLRLKLVLIAGLALAIHSKFVRFPLQDEDNGKERVMQVKGADYETERVIHGKPAMDGMFPWTVALYENGFFSCTGSIISETAVLTAAHCVNAGQDPLPVSRLSGVIGSINRSAYEAKRITFRKIRTHPQYVFVDLVNDVAILETTNPIVFNNKIQPLCLAHKNASDLVNRPVIIIGWGLDFRGANSYPEILQYDDQIIAPNEHCSRLYRYIFPNTKLCVTGFNEQYSGVCIGDSGGPLVYYEEGRPFQVGIVSHGDADAGCGSPIGFDVFSRISAYIDFIKSAATGRICVQPLSTSSLWISLSVGLKYIL